jgi:hypothetical protein
MYCRICSSFSPTVLTQDPLVAAWGSLVLEMHAQDGMEIEWTVPDAYPWLTRCLDPATLEQVAGALTRFVRDDAPLPRATLSTTIG